MQTIATRASRFESRPDWRRTVRLSDVLAGIAFAAAVAFSAAVVFGVIG
jgi:hypothetical protein